MDKERVIKICNLLRKLGVEGVCNIVNIWNMGKESSSIWNKPDVRLTTFAFRDMFNNPADWVIEKHKGVVGGFYYIASVEYNGIVFSCFISDDHVLDDMTCDLQSKVNITEGD